MIDKIDKFKKLKILELSDLKSLNNELIQVKSIEKIKLAAQKDLK